VPSTGHQRDRDLVQAIRAELAAIEPQRACCRAAERAGLGSAAAGRARTPAVARLAVRLDDGPVPGAAARERRSPSFSWDEAASHCRQAWLRGRFLAAGSLSVSEGRIHLEFVTQPEEAARLAERLAAIGLPASWRLRRGRGVVTWKGSERIVTFLRYVGGSAQVLELESRLVTRHLRSHLNRVLNAETANLGRVVAASARQLDAIATLEATGRLAQLPERDRAVARVRATAPEATLSDLAHQLGASRSQVQRSLGRLEAAADRVGRGSTSR
jgi:DNA-binding transcriptional regulator WhiA